MAKSKKTSKKVNEKVIYVILIAFLLLSLIFYKMRLDSMTYIDPEKTMGESIKYVQLNNSCNNGPAKGFTIKLNKAYLISSFANFPETKIREIKSLNPNFVGLLALEAEVRNTNTSGNIEGIYGNDVLRLRRGTIDSTPIVYGATMLLPQSNGILYTYFPLLEDEDKFKLMYCNFSKNPAIVDIDFSNERSEQLTGSYLINHGFVSAN